VRLAYKIRAEKSGYSYGQRWAYLEVCTVTISEFARKRSKTFGLIRPCEKESGRGSQRGASPERNVGYCNRRANAMQPPVGRGSATKGVYNRTLMHNIQQVPIPCYFPELINCQRAVSVSPWRLGGPTVFIDGESIARRVCRYELAVPGAKFQYCTARLGSHAAWLQATGLELHLTTQQESLSCADYGARHGLARTCVRVCVSGPGRRPVTRIIYRITIHH
jgi:hypothetical protein